MARFESKNTVLTKKLNGVVYELLVKTSSNMVYTDDQTTLTEVIADITDILATFNDNFTEVRDQIRDLIGSSVTVEEDLRDIWKYINVDGDPKSALINLIDSKVDKVDGKGLSECDFTTIMKEKLVNDYTKDELIDKFHIISNQMAAHDNQIQQLASKVDSIESGGSTFISSTTGDRDDIRALPDGAIWFKIIVH